MGVVRKDSIKNTLITYVGIGVGYINKGLLFPLLFSASEVGLANIIVLLAGFFSQFSSLGAEMILLRFFPFFKHKKDGFGGVLRLVLLIVIIGFSILTLIMIIGHDFFVSYYIEKSPLLIEYYYWIIPIGISGTFYIIFEHYLRVLSKNIISIFFQVFIQRILVLIALILFYFKFYSFEEFIIIFFSITFIPSVALFIYLLLIKKFFIQKKYVVIKNRLRRMMISYGIFVYFNSLGRNLILMADTTMLASIVGLDAVGVYVVMVFLANAAFVPYVSLIRISVPYVSIYWKDKDKFALSELYNRISRIGFFITFLLFSLIWFSFDNLLYFLPEEYLNGKYIFLFLIMGRLFDAIGGINGDILLTSKKYKKEVMITVPLILISFYLNYLLIPIYKGEGAAIATCIVMLFFNSARLAVNYYYFKLQPFDARMLKIILLAVIMFFIGSLIPNTKVFFLDLFLDFSIPVLLYLIPVYLLKLVPEINQFIDLILNKIKRV